jgi:hypothetical protein
MQCLIDTTIGARPNCLTCSHKPLCDDFTRVIFRHKDPEKKKPWAEKQADLLKPESRYHNLK